MVDTIRSLTALQALLADNTTGDISPQDVRDLLVSTHPGLFYQPATIGEYDDYFTADNSSNWTTIAPDTGTAIWTYQHLSRLGENRGVQSVFFSQNATDLGGYVTSLSGITTGDYIQAAFDWRVMNTMFAGLMFTDGTTSAANFALAAVYHASNIDQIVGVDGTLTAGNAGTFTQNATGGGPYHFRLLYSAANTFDVLVSMNGEDFRLINTITHTMTPTHGGFGVAAQNVGGGAEGLIQAKYFHSNVTS